MRFVIPVFVGAFCCMASAQLSTKVWSFAGVVGDTTATASAFFESGSLPNGQFVTCGYSVDGSGNFGSVLAFYSRSGALVKKIADPLTAKTQWRSLTVSSTGEIIVAGQKRVGALDDTIVSKYSQTGDLAWSRQIHVSNVDETDSVGRVAVMPSGDIYVCGSGPSNSFTASSTILHLTPTGSAVGQSRIVPENLASSTTESVTADSFGNSYAVGISPTGRAFIWSAQPNGQVRWSRTFQNTDGKTLWLKDVVFDAVSQKVAACGTDVTSSNFPLIQFFNPANGDTSKIIRSTRTKGIYFRLAVDPSQNLMAGGYIYDTNTGPLICGKYTFGGETWSAQTAVKVSVDRSCEFKVDSLGESYVSSTLEGAQSTVQLAKISAVGGVRFTQSLPVVGSQDDVYGLALHPTSGDIFISGATSTSKSLGAIYRQAPVAIVDGFILKKNTTYTSTKTLTTNDRQWQGATTSLAQNVTHGTLTLNSNGTFVYKPTTGFVGIDTFKYTLSKPGLTPSTAQVTLQVTS